MVCSSTITERWHKVRQQIQVLGFYLAGFLCLVLAVLKLTIEGHWSWWRVLLPLCVVLGHNALYITVGFVWLFFADDGAAGEEVTSVRTTDLPVTNWRRCCVSLFSPITCWDKSRDQGRPCGFG